MESEYRQLLREYARRVIYQTGLFPPNEPSDYRAKTRELRSEIDELAKRLRERACERIRRRG